MAPGCDLYFISNLGSQCVKSVSLVCKRLSRPGSTKRETASFGFVNEMQPIRVEPFQGFPGWEERILAEDASLSSIDAHAL